MNSGMHEDLIERIDMRIKAMGTTRSAIAKAAGLGHTYIKDLLSAKSGPNIGKIQQLADALDVDYEFLLYGKTSVAEEIFNVPVKGIVQAGHFLDISEMQQFDDEEEVIPVQRDMRAPQSSQYALKVFGDSMDILIAPGSYVICANLYAAGWDENRMLGKIVHVERTHGQLIESTLKEVAKENGKILLVPRSHNEKYKPIELNGNEETEISIKGVVIGQYIQFDL